MVRFVRVGLFVVGVAALLSGCGGGGPAIAEAEGVLTGPDGKPMPDVLVQFNPDAPGGGKVVASSAVTDASGRYVLKCDDGRAGAVAGPHRVVLIDNAFTAEDEPNPMKAPPPRGKRVNRIPPTYLSPTSTPLQVTVESGKKTYDLKVAPR